VRRGEGLRACTDKNGAEKRPKGYSKKQQRERKHVPKTKKKDRGESEENPEKKMGQEAFVNDIRK